MDKWNLSNPFFSLSIILIIIGWTTQLMRVNSLLSTNTNNLRETTYYTPKKCQNATECDHVCDTENSPDLNPLCDRNGTCVCDCSNKEEINSKPVPPPCATWISSMEHDRCSQYCNLVYARPSKICGDTASEDPSVYCTCLCKWY